MKYKVDSIQITIDGDRDCHDKRILANGQGTYDKILNNLALTKDYLPENVSVRINVDKNNAHRYKGLLEDIKSLGLGDLIYIYLVISKTLNDSYKDLAAKQG